MQRKINWHGDLFTNGENLHDKNLTRWFWGHYSRESTLSKQAVTNKEIQ